MAIQRLVLLALAVLPALALSGASALPARATPTHQVQAPDTTQARYPFETRLRKLHLVRPDLIPYPAVQEFFA